MQRKKQNQVSLKAGEKNLSRYFCCNDTDYLYFKYYLNLTSIYFMWYELVLLYESSFVPSDMGRGRSSNTLGRQTRLELNANTKINKRIWSIKLCQNDLSGTASSDCTSENLHTRLGSHHFREGRGSEDIPHLVTGLPQCFNWCYKKNTTSKKCNGNGINRGWEQRGRFKEKGKKTKLMLRIIFVCVSIFGKRQLKFLDTQKT